MSRTVTGVKTQSLPKSVLVVMSVLSLVAAFLVSGVVGSSVAQAATPSELTSFTFKSGTIVGGPNLGPMTGTYNLAGVSVTDGTFTVSKTNPVASLTFISVKATSNALDVQWNGYGTVIPLAGSNWRSYSGVVPVTEGRTFAFSNVNINNPPTPDPSGKKPRAPKSLKVTGAPTAKSFKVSWTKPSTKGKRPVTGYRVIVKAQGAKKAAVNKKLGKKARSYKVSRKVLLKSLRSMNRGEGSVRFQVRLSALNGNSQSVYAKRSFWVTP